MSDRTAIINMALTELSEPHMSGPNDQSSWVRKLTQNYEPIARQVLSGYPWNFAMKREQLAVSDSYAGDLGARTYAYKKPANCLFVALVNDTGDTRDTGRDNYDDEDGVIKADMSPLWLWYVDGSYLTREGSWPELFAYAVAVRLAWICAPTSTKKETTKDRLMKDAKVALQKAKTWDAQQKPRRENPIGDWARSRFGGGLSSYRSRTGSDIVGGGS